MVSYGIFFFFTLQGITFTLLLLEYRFSLRRTLLAVYGFALVLLVWDLGLYRVLGPERFLLLYPLTNHLPCILVLTYVSQYRNWRFLFQLLSSVFFCLLTQHLGGLLYYLSGQRLWALYLAYGAFTALMAVLILRVLRPICLQALRQLQHGWWLMCLVLAGYYGITIYLIPGFTGESEGATVLKPALSLLMVGFYAVAFFFLSSAQRENEARHSAELAALRLSALQGRMEAVQAAEEAVRVERHDLRHRLQTVSALISKGREGEALDFLSAARQRLDEIQPVRWCHPPILDAVFASYFSQAKGRGIRVEAQIAFPPQLPADETELAVVFANALENAIRACMELPEPARIIRCRVIRHPGLMFVISNPCAGVVCFDEHGLPRSDGHGLGTRSISAFCKKYGALCRYEWAEGWFFLRVIF